MAGAQDFSQFPEVGSSSPKAQDFSQFPESTTPEPLAAQAGAFAEAGGRGALQSLGVTGGMVTGGAIGSAITPGVGTAIGAVAGGLYGLWAGTTAAEGLGLRAPEQMPQEVRPAAYAGESFGGALSIAGETYAIARTGVRLGESMVGRFLNQVMDTARTAPVRFAVGEVSSAASAAIGAGLAEVAAPGRLDVRVNAETAAGLLNPTRLAIDLGSWGYNKVKNVVTGFMPAAQQTKAAQVLQDLVNATGEDPAAVAKVLRAAGVLDASGKPLDMTASQKSGSAALAALEDFLAKGSPKFKAGAGQKARDALDAIRGQIILLRGTGDPNALKVAAELQTGYFRTLIQAKVNEATGVADAFARGISADTPASRAALSERAYAALDQSIKDVRAAESKLWAAVDGNRAVGFENLQNALDNEVAKLLPEVVNEKTPAIVRNFLNRVAAPKKAEESLIILPESMRRPRGPVEPVGTNVAEMRQLRGELLDLARTSTNAGEYGQARIYNNLAEAVLDDMDTAFRAAGDTAYDQARTFSRELNDTFTRSFAGKAMATGRFGNRVAPEILLRKAMATGKEAGALQMQELEEATRFLQVRGMGDAESVNIMLDAQQRILRLAAADTVDPLTGKANPRAIAKFVRDNEILLNRFPEVRRDLTSAQMSEQYRSRIETLAKDQINIVEKQKLFGRLASDKGDPITLAAKALLSPNQEKDLVDLVKITKALPKKSNADKVVFDEAKQGLRASVFDAAARQATDRNGIFNIDQFQALLMKPSVSGGKSPMQILQEQGVIDPNAAKEMKKFFTAAESIVRSSTSGTAVEVDLGLGDVAMQTLSRMIGSKVVGVVSDTTGGGGGSIIMHGAGARFAESLMTKIPDKSVRGILIEAMNDPEKMALLLEKVSTPEQVASKARRIHAWLVQSNLTAVTEGVGQQEDQSPFMFQ